MSVVVLYAFDLVVRCFQLRVGDYDDMHVASLFERIDFLALFVEKISGAFDRNLGQDLAGVVLQGLFLEQAQHCQRQ